jgi:hypothetical protein
MPASYDVPVDAAVTLVMDNARPPAQHRGGPAAAPAEPSSAQPVAQHFLGADPRGRAPGARSCSTPVSRQAPTTWTL